jgi:AcrR family transcriptional regulator
VGVKERREREKAELRQKILDAARELFAERGYEAVSMRMIADRIEYSPTAIYLHFRDKDALFQELCQSDFRALAGVFNQIARQPDPVERLRRIGLLYADFARDKPHHYRLMFMTPQPPEAFEHVNLEDRGNPEADAYALLVETVREAIEQGRFRPELTDAEQVAQMVWAGVHGVVSLRITKNGPWITWTDRQALVELMIDATMRGLLREPAAVDA